MENEKFLEDSPGIELIGKSFSKMKHNMEKDGYREGIEEGKQKVFQKYFDEGYIDGFKNGRILGKIKGERCAKLILENLAEPDNEVLSITTRGACVLCKNAANISNRVNKIKEEQSQTLDNIVNNMTIVAR